MTTEETRQVIKSLSFIHIDGRRNNYRLPNGTWCKDAIEELIWKIMDNFNCVVDEELCFQSGYYKESNCTYINVASKKSKEYTLSQMERNVSNLAGSFFR